MAAQQLSVGLHHLGHLQLLVQAEQELNTTIHLSLNFVEDTTKVDESPPAAVAIVADVSFIL